ncbi:hypothetical protein RFI_30645, partial [Reticulomyxa filosa]
SIYARIESANTEAWKIHQDLNAKLDIEERVFKEIKDKLGPHWQVMPSAQLNGKYRSDLKMIGEFLNQAVASNTKLEKEIHENAELFRDLEKSREELSSNLPKPNEEDENSQSPIAEKLKGLLDELNACIALREELKQQYVSQIENMDIAGLLMATTTTTTTMTTTMTEEKSQDATNLTVATTDAFKDIARKIYDTGTTQVKLLDAITDTNDQFVNAKGSHPVQVSRQHFFHRLNQACEKFNKTKAILKDGLKFYSDLMTDYITILQS